MREQKDSLPERCELSPILVIKPVLFKKNLPWGFQGQEVDPMVNMEGTFEKGMTGDLALPEAYYVVK